VFRPFTLPALVFTLGAGLAAIAVGSRFLRPVGPAATGPASGAGMWAVLAGAAGLWQLQAFLQHPRSEHPTVSSMTNPLLQSSASRALAMLLWLAAGVWLARR
jgi:hypothetical protein